MSELNQLANLEALLNIVVNAAEILFFSAAFPMFIFVALPSLLGFKGYSLRMFLCIIFSATIGLVSPTLVEAVVSVLRTNSSPLGLVMLILTIVFIPLLSFGCIGYLAFLPSLIARSRGLKRRRVIFLVNLLTFFIPLSWLALMIWCYFEAKKEREQVDSQQLN
ncbi:MAG TPA: superinfection immunity protein [Candidatus Obscuribacter sp.]|nr:superinfection immunity protein [Candidatus Obscuribacter sp.]HNG22160.1 superinfection immunity protein [Candidatus Obscuribacter sp.]